MSVPTKAGVYLWRPNADSPWQWRATQWHRWFGMEGQPTGQHCLAVTRIRGPVPVEEHGGEWGPRIPDPERLQAMHELTTIEPMCGINYGGGCDDSICFYCGAPWRDEDTEHDSDCPWLRAQPEEGQQDG